MTTKISGGGGTKRKGRQSPEREINQRVKRALNSWAMFPPSFPTSTSTVNKTIICQSRHVSKSEEQQQFWEQQLNFLVPARKLPTVIPLDASRLADNDHIGVTIRIREGERVETVMASATVDTTTTNYDDQNSNTNLVGATIRIKRGKFVGMIGKIVECIEGSAIGVAAKSPFKGKWYVTDNIKISNAFQEHTFDVLTYADGERNKKIDAVGDGDRGGGSAVDTRLEGKTRVNIGPANKENAAGAATRTADNKFMKVGEVRRDINDKHQKQIPSSDTVRERSLIGATVVINKGKYKGYSGVVLEQMCVRRLQVDTVPVPLALEDVQVLQYANTYTATPNNDDDHRNNNDDAHFEQKYTGAKVRCIANEFSGTLGTIIRVLNLGEWCITDNPKIATALRASNFDVLKYVDKNMGNVPIICIDDDDDDDAVKKDEKMKCRDKEDHETNAKLVADDANVVGLCQEKAASDDFVDTTMVEQQPPSEANDAAANEKSKDRLKAEREEAISQPQRHDSTQLRGVNESADNDVIDLAESENPASKKTRLAADADQNRAADDSEKRSLHPSADDNYGEVKDGRDDAKEKSNAKTRADDKESATAKTKCMAVCSVKLPTIESIELAARLSAFDSFLFLADGYGKGCGGQTTTIHHINEEASTKCASTVTSTAIANGGHPRTTQTSGDNSNDEYNANSNNAMANFVINLFQRNLKSHNLPTAKVIPGMKVSMEEKQPLRIVPLEERTVRLVPGSREEGSELAKRLSAFDDYLFF